MSSSECLPHVFSQISLFFGFILWQDLRKSSTSKNLLVKLTELKSLTCLKWRLAVSRFSYASRPRDQETTGSVDENAIYPVQRAPDVCVHATFFLYLRPNRACPGSRKPLPRSQFAKLKVDTFIFYLNGKCVIKYDWSRHLLDHYSSRAWFSKLEKPASSIK